MIYNPVQSNKHRVISHRKAVDDGTIRRYSMAKDVAKIFCF
jgi:hypothetical protein